MINKNCKTLVKKGLKLIICIASMVLAIYTSIPLASANTSILGTNAALGSPILNNDATIDDWNKWEIICWGVYLSNFCQPFVDDYNTAFNTGQSSGFGGAGSDGAGHAALYMGTGSDKTNEETIDDFCNYAITQQTSGQLKPVYVGFNKLEDGKYTERVKETDTDKIRDATASDLLIVKGSTDDKSSLDFSELTASSYGTQFNYARDGRIPTFYIKDPDNKFVKIFDYTNSWDVQVFANLMYTSAESNDDNVKNQFKSNISEVESKIGSDDQLRLMVDIFGNILLENGVLIIPASANQHITTDPAINIINQYICNSYISTSSADMYVSGVQSDAYWDASGTFYYATQSDRVDAGTSALSKSTIGKIGTFYFDTDSILGREIASNGSSATINYGPAVLELFDSDIGHNNTLPLKYEISGMDIEKLFSETGGDDTLKYNYQSAVCLSNINDINTQQEILNYIAFPNGSKQDIFGNEAIVAIQYNLPYDSGDASFGLNAGAQGKLEVTGMMHNSVRKYYNRLYKWYTGKIQADGMVSRDNFITNLKSISTYSDFTSNAMGPATTGYWDTMTVTPKFTEVMQGGILHTADMDIKTIVNETQLGRGRLIKIFSVNDVYAAVASLLSMEDGTEFARYSPYVYMTYLDFYGVINQVSQGTGTDAVSNFSPRVYDPTSDILNVDLSTIYNTKSQDDLKEEALNLAYLMLDPETGQTYRNNMIYSTFENSIFENYNRIVYGGASATYTGSSSKSNTGFFYVPSYLDNFLVAQFIENYTSIAMVLIGICIVLLVIVGLLTGKKIGYYIFGLITIVNVIIIVPSSGEILPYIVSTACESMFKSKMTFWTLNEGIANASIEADSVTQSNAFSGLTEDEANLVQYLVRNISSTYTDRSLNLKQDISQKLTQPLVGAYESIQYLPSARWILPTLMQQYSADVKEDSEQYVYVTLANVWDDASNIYWYYYPTDAQTVTKKTNNSKYYSDGDPKCAQAFEKYDQMTQYYKDLKLVDDDLKLRQNQGIQYQNFAYTCRPQNDTIVHLYNWVLPDATRRVESYKNAFNDDLSGYEDVDSWEKYFSAQGNGTFENWKTDKNTGNGELGNETNNYAQDGFEIVASSYNRFDCETMKAGYGYYKSTESPFYYMFAVTKDQFEYEKSLAGVSDRLQGHITAVDKDFNVVDTSGYDYNTYQEKLKSGELQEVRVNFLYATKSDTPEVRDSFSQKGVIDEDIGYTPYVRDILDLEYMFNNTIPYLYKMTLLAGGFDGVSGITGDKEITNLSDFYQGNKMSWAYRCNWATKLMENPELSKAAQVRVRDADGNVTNTYTVKNPMMPELYEAVENGRPMVFSEAQQHAYNLDDSDLTLAELKCIKINRDTAKNWTLMLNYVSTKGLTKEVLFRQMATDATINFCQEFSSGGIMNNSYGLFPRTIDLRHLSFDAVMKMLMLGVSKDSGYMYNSTMQKVIQDQSIGLAILLLVDAWLCAYGINIFRCILMAAIFYLGFVSILRVLFASTAIKTRCACGTLAMNIWFALSTLLYYGIFILLMSQSSADEVIVTQAAFVKTGNPVTVLVVVLIANIIYMVLMAFQLKFIWDNRADMGFTAVKDFFSRAASNISDGLSGIANKFNGGGATIVTGSTAGEISSVSKGGKKSNNKSNGNTSGEVVTTSSKQDNTDDEDENRNKDLELGGSGRMSNRNPDSTSAEDAKDIDKEIEKGEETKS